MPKNTAQPQNDQLSKKHQPIRSSHYSLLTHPKLRKFETALHASASMINSYGLPYSAILIGRGWPKANQQLINQISLNSGLGLMLANLAEGLATTMEINKLETLRSDYKSANAGISTFVFSLQTVIAAWVYIASDYGRDDKDIYISHQKFAALATATASLGLFKFIFEVINNHSFLNKKEQEYRTELSLLKALSDGYSEIDRIHKVDHEIDTENVQPNQAKISKLNKKLNIISKLKKCQPIINALFSTISSASFISGLSTSYLYYVHKEDIRKHYTIQGISYLTSLACGTGLAAVSYNSPQKVARIIDYVSAILMLMTMINSYLDLEKNPDTKVNANILAGLWAMLLAIPLTVTAIRSCASSRDTNLGEKTPLLLEQNDSEPRLPPRPQVEHHFNDEIAQDRSASESESESESESDSEEEIRVFKNPKKKNIQTLTMFPSADEKQPSTDVLAKTRSEISRP